MSRKFEYDVFLSYSSRDKKVVHALAARLKKDGLRVWLDSWVIQPGDPIGLKIQRGLEHSRTLVMCMSAAYFDSDWATLEHHTLLFRDPTNAQRRFIPLLIGDCARPDVIAQFAYVDWRAESEEAYEKLMGACRGGEEKRAEVAVRKERIYQARMVLRGHSGEIWDGVAITPDGKTIVSGSSDKTLKVWDLDTGHCRATLRGHTESVFGLAITPDGKVMISSSGDKTLKVWDLETGKSLATLIGHLSSVWSVAVTRDGRTIISSSDDNTLKMWDLKTGKCHATFTGHTDAPRGLALTPDGKKVVSASLDATLRVWDLETRQCLATLHGHTGMAFTVAVTPDGKTIISSSTDRTLKVWDLETGHCRATFEGHASDTSGLAVTPDGKIVVSGSYDKTLKVWDLETGRCSATLEGHIGGIIHLAITPDGRKVVSGSMDTTLRVWDLPAPLTVSDASTRYTNAKVVLIGESGVGKTGLSLRLCQDRWEATESTHGMVVSRLEAPQGSGPAGVEREIWLWDFAGQPDYRLIHQLYMDETALGVLVFDPQDDNPFENIGYWEKALRGAGKYEPAKMLVAARSDRGGITISGKRFEQYCAEHGFTCFLSTGAKTGEGCAELAAAIVKHIPWERLPWTATSRLFKTLKDAILKLTDEDAPLARLPELRQRLQLLLPQETIGDAELRAVVGLMQSQGVVQMLAFGEFVLLQPEWINRYASVVVRMAREHADELGVVPEQQVLDGRLDYKDMKRLGGEDERSCCERWRRRF